MYDMFDMKFLKAFLNNQSGAVTVDFVVLTAAAVVIAAAAIAALSGKVATALTNLAF